MVIAFKYCFLSLFSSVSPHISIHHYIFVFICYPDFIYESCRQILCRAFLRRCSEGKQGNPKWRGLLFFRPPWMSITPEDCWTFQLIHFCYQGIDTCSIDRLCSCCCCCCCCGKRHLSAKVRMCPSPIRVQRPSRQSSSRPRALPGLTHVIEAR